MKLLKAHIHNFGILHEQDFVFNQQLTEFIQKNGTGKTTLTDFLKVMLYDMDTDRETDKGFKERRHYAPFNGLKFGGVLEFEHEGKTYHIEKTFDVKSSSKDKNILFIDNQQVAYPNSIGEQVLNLNKESFERLFVISNVDIAMESNGDIKNHLNGIINNTDSEITYDSICESIKAAMGEYTRKGSGKIAIAKEQKDSLEKKIVNQRRIKDALPDKYKRRNAINEEFKRLQARQAEANDQKSILTCWETYEGKLSAINQNKAELDKIIEKYSNGYPTKEELTQLNELLSEKDQILGKLNSTFDPEKERRLTILSDRYGGGVPTKEEITTLSSLNKELVGLHAKKATATIGEETAKKLEALKLTFKLGVPTEEQLSKVEKQIKLKSDLQKDSSKDELSLKEQEIKDKFDNKPNYSNDLNTLNDLANKINVPQNGVVILSTPTKKAKLPYILSAIAGLAILVVGLVLAFVIEPMFIGIILGVVGLLAILVTGFLFLMNANKHVQQVSQPVAVDNSKAIEEAKAILESYGIDASNIAVGIDRLETQHQEYEDILKTIKERNLEKKETELKLKEADLVISSFIKLYRQPTGDDTKDIRMIRDDMRDYANLLEQEAKNQKTVEDIQESLDENENKVNEILGKYSIVSNENLDQMINDFEKFNSITNDYKLFKERNNEGEDSLDKVTQSIKKITDKYSLKILDGKASLVDINNDVATINSLQSSIKQGIEDAEKYKVEKQLITKPTNCEDLEELSNELNTKRRELTEIEKEIDENERETADLLDNETAFEEVVDLLAKYSKRLNILAKTAESMNAAQKILDDTYVEPVMNTFKKYEEQLGKVFGCQITMGRNFNIQLEVNGEIKSYEYLSSGQKAICALCFRLALLDNIYQNDIPFIIMDDPFTDLDNENFDLASKLIKELSKNNQFIYLTCHNSREIK